MAEHNIPHGTIAGYQQHLYYGHVEQWNKGEILKCHPCLNGHAEVKKLRRSKEPENVKRHKRLLSKATTRALYKLKFRHMSEFKLLYKQSYAEIMREESEQQDSARRIRTYQQERVQVHQGSSDGESDMASDPSHRGGGEDPRQATS